MKAAMSKTVLAGIALALLTVACQSLENTHSEVTLRELYAGNQCAVTGAELRVIDGRAAALALTGSHRIGAMPPALKIDDSHELMLLVAAGQKPSAGYRLHLTKSDAGLHDETLHLPVSLSTPGQDAQAALMTSPCLLLALQRGPYRRIVVENLGLELELPEDF
jgi:hypothetical protein